MKRRLESEEHRIEIGRLGEYGARTVRFKLTEFNNIPSPEQSGEIPELNPSDPDYEYLHHIYYPADGQTWHGNAMVLIHQRSRDFAPYVVENYFISGDELVWNIGADDTACEGIGYAEIHMANSGVMLAKSIQYLTFTDERLGSTTEPRSYEEITINTITAIAASALSYKDSAAAFAAAAEDSASDAAASAAAAAESAGAMVSPPYIGPNHNWYVWSNDGYVDSGISAQGEPGPNVINGNTLTTINGMIFGNGISIGAAPLVGTCDTAADVAAKVVSINHPSPYVNPVLFGGMMVIVTFDYGNTASNPTLKFGTTDAKPIKYGEYAIHDVVWEIGETRAFIYDSDNSVWVMQASAVLWNGGPTSINGLVAGDGFNLHAVSVDWSPTEESWNPVSSGGVYLQLGGKAPTNHKSTATTYGKGDGTNYGHVKLSDDSDDTTHTATDGIAATPFAVANLRDWVATLDEALDSKAPLSSPELIGTPTAPTAAAGDSSTQIATTAFVANAVGGALPLISFGNMATGNTQANLLAALDANDSNIPLGVSAVRIGSSANPNKALILCIKATSTTGRGFSISPYADINRLNLYLDSTGWSVVT